VDPPPIPEPAPAPVVAGEAPPAVAPPTDRPPEERADVAPPRGMRSYYLVMLRRGPNWTADDTPRSRELGAGHMKHIAELAEAGKLLVAGPFLGQTDADDYAGIYVFDTDSLAETRALAEADPAVAAGRFVPEYLIWMAAKGLRVNPLVAAPTAVRTPSPCTTDAQRAFDFWVGEWTVRDPKGTVVGVNRVDRAHGGCALIEHWSSVKGGSGTSINYYDRSRKRWVQTWVDGMGSVIQLEGGLEDGAMKLGGTFTRADGTSTLLRGSWQPLPGGKVRQLFEQSKDGGISWETWFDGTYEPR
jgi:uncharacterized protein YciI